MTDDADRANFGGNARENSTGVDSGQQLYQDHGPVSPVLLKSLTISDVACNGDLTKATIFGTATLNGTGSRVFRIDVQDLGEPGKLIDTYRIRVDDGYDSGEHRLRGGNIQVH